MDPISFANEQAKQLLDAQAHIWNHVFYFLDSMSLKCAIQLNIPEAIQKHGKPITLAELSTELDLHPTKASTLNRLMRMLVHSKFFSKKELVNGEFLFDLNTKSQLLLKDHPLSLAPFALVVLDPTMTDPAHHITEWLRDGSQSAFNVAHGRSIWEHAGCVTMFNEHFNQAMASDARFVARLLTTNNDSKGVFKGIESLVDVGGGDGTMAKALAQAHPELKCIVLDLPHVVEGLKGGEPRLLYVGGDMFESIPSAQAVLEDCYSYLHVLRSNEILYK